VSDEATENKSLTTLEMVSDGNEVRCVGRMFHRLEAETGKAERLKDGTITWSELDDWNLGGDGKSATPVK